MSKEMTLIILGLFVMALRTLLGLPGTWQTVLLVLAGGAVAVIGFLLRGESLARGGREYEHSSFVESKPHPQPHHERPSERITSLN